MAPMEVIELFLLKMEPVPGTFCSPHTPTLPPYRSASGIGYASKKLYKIVGNPASYLMYNRYNELLE